MTAPRFGQGMQGRMTEAQVVAASGRLEAVDDIVILADQAERGRVAAIEVADDCGDGLMVEAVAGALPIGDHGFASVADRTTRRRGPERVVNRRVSPAPGLNERVFFFAADAQGAGQLMADEVRLSIDLELKRTFERRAHDSGGETLAGLQAQLAEVAQAVLIVRMDAG